MQIANALTEQELYSTVSRTMHSLGIPVHRIGYKQLCMAIVCYIQNDAQSMTKELYPFIARHFGYSDWHPVEHAIRLVILHAWESRDLTRWNYYFPISNQPPTNKQFIAAIAEYM